MDYIRRIYDLPADLEDVVAATLWRLGALGCEIKAGDGPGRTRLEVWFDDGADEPDLAAWPGVEAVAAEQVAAQDWLANYRAISRPFEVGRKFRVDPGDQPGSFDDGRILLHVPAENAFGTGSHESTRLALLWLEQIEPAGMRVLDVGSGSGILAFAAGHLGAASILGFDFDVPSVITARRNISRNFSCDTSRNTAPRAGRAPRFLAATAGCLCRGRHFDLLLINVLPERIWHDLPRLISTLVPRGLVVSSGNLLERRGQLLSRFEAAGLTLAGEKVEGEWTSFLFRGR